MALTKKKSQTPVKKSLKRVTKKVATRSVKKVIKSVAKRKTKAAAVKKTKRPARRKGVSSVHKKTTSPVRKKVISTANNKTKSPVSKKTPSPVNKEIKSAPQQAAMPEVIKPEEALHPVPVQNEMLPNIIEEHKTFEHQFENRADVVMNKENQKVKSAMANRQKRIFHTQRHS
ncbi:MAG TPA: hypothetical protein VE978_21345 [Chitinophagales bacterium]|nr:hypothetical protein [Chitinophagales bacterium]